MTTSCVSVTTMTIAASAFSFVRPDDVQEGDLMIAFFTADTFTVATPPDSSWTHVPLGPSGGSGYWSYTYFKYATASEPASYAFSVTPHTVLQVGAFLVYRGVIRDFATNPIAYPHGFFAQSDFLGITNLDFSSSVAHSNSGVQFPFITPYRPYTLAPFSRIIYFTLFRPASGTPELDDVTPLVDIRATLYAPRWGFVIYDHEEPVALPPPASAADLVVRGTPSTNWTTYSLVIESADASPPHFDNYKAKVMRHMLPSPYDQDFGSVMGKVLTIIGQSDNLIGGLFGSDDFLPDEG